jgi:AraC-like DNA-binding protein
VSDPSIGFWCREMVQLQPMAHAHAHGDLEWNFARSGSLTYRHGRRTITIKSGRLAIFWAGISHQLITTGGPSTAIVGVLPLQRFLAWRLPPQALQRLLDGEILTGPVDEYADDQRQLKRWFTDLDHDNAGLRDLVELEARARFTRLLMTGNREPSNTPAAVHRLLDQLIDAGNHGLSVAACAAAAGLNPKYASALMRRFTGLTPAAFRTGYRIDRALPLLLEQRLSIEAIGKAVGFESSSSFYDTFTKRLGLTPSQWRSQQEN